MCVCVAGGKYVLVTTDAQGSQKRTSDSLNLKLGVVVSLPTPCPPKEDAGNQIQHLQEQCVQLSHLSSPSRYEVCA